MNRLVRVTISSLISILIMVSFANAQTDLADYLSQKIYNDCSGQRIDMSGTISRLLISENKSYIFNSPVTPESLKEVVSVIVNNEPYDMWATVFTTSSDKDGKNILSCGNKSLSINYLTYYWNGKRVDPFVIITQKIENISQKVEKIENYYTNASGQPNIAIGSNAKSEQSNWSVKISIFDISLFTLGGLSVYFLMKWKNKKSKD